MMNEQMNARLRGRESFNMEQYPLMFHNIKLTAAGEATNQISNQKYLELQSFCWESNEKK